MHIKISLDFFEKYPGIAFFLHISKYVSNEQPCLKTTGLYADLLLLCSLVHLISHLVSPLHLVYDFQFPSLFQMSFLKSLSSTAEKLLHIYVNSVFNVCILENLRVFA